MKPNGQQSGSGGSGYISVKGVPSLSTAGRRLWRVHSGTLQTHPSKASHLILGLILSSAFAVILLGNLFGSINLLEITAGWMVFGVLADGGAAKWIKAGTRRDWDKNINVFTLSFSSEVVTLDPGKSWTQVDHYRWAIRGLIDEPQLFRVLPNGTVEINTEKISAGDPAGVTRLEQEINRRLGSSPASKPTSVSSPAPSAAVPPPSPRGIHFKVKLDHWGHMLVEWFRGLERDETGLRGIPTLVANGLMVSPNSFHVDPLQRSVEIDGVRFECNEAGARQLEEALNSRYVPRADSAKTIAIEVRENLAASSGFDIRFAITRASVPTEVKGHLSQETLDLLADPEKCQLLQPGVQLRLSPPNLLIRRRRHDLSEQKIPELPDVNYRHITSVQLEQILNHPLIRRSDGPGSTRAQTLEQRPTDIAELRVVRHAADKMLWLECVTARGQTHGGKAFTHHNIAELQHGGVFLPHLDVCLSLDHRKLSVLNKQTRQDETVDIDLQSSDDDLKRAGRMLTNALKPPASPPEEPPAAVTEEPPQLEIPFLAQPAPVITSSESPARATAEHTLASPPAATLSLDDEIARVERMPKKPVPAPVEQPPAMLEPQPEPEIVALFRETDPLRINQEIFRRLSPHFGIAVQDIRLSLECVFKDRRFEVLNFEGKQIGSLMDLRAEDFYGFYLSHINESKVILVYGCNGMHVEWGTMKCVLQSSLKTEADEFNGSALLGLAQDRNDQFVFVVQPAFKEWLKPRVRPYTDQTVHFVTVADLATAPGDYTLIWPERSAPRL